jgi:tetratricopeptide (TPR) repeat protein
MRFGRKSDRNRVEWLVKFLTTWYDKSELQQKAIQLISNIQHQQTNENYVFHMCQAMGFTGMLNMHIEHYLKEIATDWLKEQQSIYADSISSSEIALLKSAMNLYETNKIDKAILLLEKSEKNSTTISLSLGLLHHEQGNIEKSEIYFLKAANNGDTMAMFYLGKIYRKSGEFKKSEYYYEKVIATGNTKAMYYLAWMYFEQGIKAHKALSLMQKVYELNNKYFIQFSYALMLLWNNCFSASYDMFDRYIHNDSEEINDKFLAGYILQLIAKGQLYQAKAFFDNEAYQLKEKLKPIWYALMTLMQDDFPHEIKRMGKELTQSVNDMLNEIEALKIKYTNDSEEFD